MITHNTRPDDPKRSSLQARNPALHRRFATTLLVLFLVLFVALGWSPWYRADWMLENVLVLVTLPLGILTYRRLPLSKVSYSAIFIFLCLHEVGAHYTYAKVPYDAWCESLFGTDLSSVMGWERNHYDRLVHFLYGVLLAYPVREVFLRVASARGFWGYLFPLLVVMSSSLLFELLEWGAVIIDGGELGVAYLGTQGDVWDAQKDSLLASVGALLTSLFVAGVNWRFDRDFGREWSESLTVKHAEPLGEVEFERLLGKQEVDRKH